MSQPFRTATHGRIDRSREIRFTFDRQTFVGHPGDTIASALLANGVHLMGRSFKYHRPRGVLGFGSEEPNALVGVDRGNGRFEPNQRATMVRLTEGLVVESQNRSPSLRRDVGAINDLLSKFIPAHATPSDAQAGAGKAFVDFQNDVTAKDIRLAVREGFQSVEHIKRYTTNGMATDQGRTSNINALAIAAQTLGKTIPEAGLTTFRAPFSPTTFGTMAGFTRGALFDPVRTPPLHDRLIGEGAVFEHAGQWKRPRYYAQPGETMDEAVLRECATVRRAAGMFDASTLGKIEVVGPDAASFLDFIYAGKPSSLGEGRSRYALMLREDGFILDDGIITRLEADRFHVTTTSAGAAAVLATMEDFRQTELPEMRVWLTSTTEQWAVIAVNGPKARDVLMAVTDDVSLTNEDFPHMSMRTGTVAAVPARIFRASFTGELGYEINVPARSATIVWDGLRRAGKQFGLGVYGLEASQVLRAEKGYIIVGRETDGTTTPDDVGLGGMVAKSKPDFVGKRSLMRDAATDPMRKQLVALLPCDGQPIEEGSQLIDPADPGHSLGHVSSAYRSAELGGPFALAMVQAGRSRIGTRLAIATANSPRPVELRDPVLVDPTGARLHG